MHPFDCPNENGRPVSPLFVSDDVYDDFDFSTDDESENDVKEETDSDMEVETQMNAPLDGVLENRSTAKKKFNLKSMMNFSSKYMATMDKFSDVTKKIPDEYEDSAKRPNKSESVFDLADISTMVQKFVSEECDFAITLPKSVIKRVKQINYLPNIAESKQSDVSEADFDQKILNYPYPLLCHWNQLNEMNKKCSEWLVKCEDKDKVRKIINSSDEEA